MIGRENAVEIAKNWFKKVSLGAAHMEYAEVDQAKIIEVPFAWVLPWNDRRFLAGDFKYEVLGNSPLVVLKRDGSVRQLPSVTPATARNAGPSSCAGQWRSAVQV